MVPLLLHRWSCYWSVTNKVDWRVCGILINKTPPLLTIAFHFWTQESLRFGCADNHEKQATTSPPGRCKLSQRMSATASLKGIAEGDPYCDPWSLQSFVDVPSHHSNHFLLDTHSDHALGMLSCFRCRRPWVIVDRNDMFASVETPNLRRPDLCDRRHFLWWILQTFGAVLKASNPRGSPVHYGWCLTRDAWLEACWMRTTLTCWLTWTKSCMCFAKQRFDKYVSRAAPICKFLHRQNEHSECFILTSP